MLIIFNYHVCFCKLEDAYERRPALEEQAKVKQINAESSKDGPVIASGSALRNSFKVLLNLLSFIYFINFVSQPQSHSSKRRNGYYLVYLILVLMPVSTTTQGYSYLQQPVFDCRRMHPRYCCATRVRYSCPQLCMTSPCSAPFSIQPYKPSPANRPIQPAPPFLPPLLLPNGIPHPNGQGHSGSIPPIPAQPTHNSNGGWSVYNRGGYSIDGLAKGVEPPAGLVLPPPDTAPALGTPVPMTAEDYETDSRVEVLPAVEGPHPTLVPEIAVVTPSGPVKGKNGAIDGVIESGAVSQIGKKGVLPPPSVEGQEGLEMIEGFGGGDRWSSRDQVVNNGVANLKPELSSWTPLKFNVHKSEDTVAARTTVADEVKAVTTTTPLSAGQILQPSFIAISRREDLPLPNEENKADITIDQKSLAPSFKNEGSKPTDSVTSNNTLPSILSNNTGIFGDKINVIIEHVFNQQTIDALAALTGRKAGSNRQNRLSKTNNNTFTTSTTTSVPLVNSSSINLLQTTTTQVSSQQCGIGPEFRPCVPVAVASKRLLSCCQQKLMPAGCLELCRYDITQPEIKKAFDAGRCGILNVAPYLECASQGNDNLACCRQRRVAAKSGSQCEVFCNPGKGLGALGIQHLSCQSVIGDLLQCHHSGLRDTQFS
uniref:Domain of unknown function DB domain-containing protein n=1 Tax=Ditylenchus dipsaci TaxID=166011 RepID=A0A915CNA4_9BILA